MVTQSPTTKIPDTISPTINLVQQVVRAIGQGVSFGHWEEIMVVITVDPFLCMTDDPTQNFAPPSHLVDAKEPIWINSSMTFMPVKFDGSTVYLWVMNASNPIPAQGQAHEYSCITLPVSVWSIMTPPSTDGVRPAIQVRLSADDVARVANATTVNIAALGVGAAFLGSVATKSK